MKPSYAFQTLEIVKHLYSQENPCFIQFPEKKNDIQRHNKNTKAKPQYISNI